MRTLPPKPTPANMVSRVLLCNWLWMVAALLLPVAGATVAAAQAPSQAPGKAPVRNLMGFRDGTANLDASNERQMKRYVWVGADDDEPEWAVGGSYMAVRVIRMFVESWDRTPLAEQEAIIGRHKKSGAPRLRFTTRAPF